MEINRVIDDSDRLSRCGVTKGFLAAWRRLDNLDLIVVIMNHDGIISPRSGGPLFRLSTGATFPIENGTRVESAGGIEAAYDGDELWVWDWRGMTTCADREQRREEETKTADGGARLWRTKCILSENNSGLWISGIRCRGRPSHDHYVRRQYK